MLLDQFPKRVRDYLLTFRENPSISRMMTRVNDFSSPTAAYLSGVAADVVLRKAFTNMVDRMDTVPGSVAIYNEIIIGGGVHSAIYSSSRTLNGRGRLAVLEQGGRVGGVFGWTDSPAFYLNSRNRSSAEAGVPGTEGELNKVINGPVQPSDLSAAEYQTNMEMCFAIRAALLRAARRSTARIESVRRTPEGLVQVAAVDGRIWMAKRVIIATGIGRPNKIRGSNTDLRQFLINCSNEPFPLSGFKRVAVIGGGDSARVAIEYLLGQGPTQGSSVASVDKVERIDWYRSPYDCREEMEEEERSRYKGIARFMKCASDDRAYVIQPLRGVRVTEVIQDDDKLGVLYKGGQRGRGDYDLVVNCTGFVNKVDELVQAPIETVFADGEAVARKALGAEIYIVGPAAELPFTREEEQKVPIELGDANKVALWRYGPKTAKLAAILP